MVAATPVDVRVNPNNNAQRYILWGNGYIEAVGGAVPITSSTQWLASLVQPVGVAIHITNWTNGVGYVLDVNGGFQPLNGAPDLSVNHDGNPDTPNWVGSVPYVDGGTYIDWDWDPSGSGQGYVLDQYGQLYAFGGAPAAPRTGRRWAGPAARKLVMQWTPTKKALTLDLFGGLHPDFGASPVGPGYPYWPYYDIARDLVVTDWTAMAGYTLDLHGGVHNWGGAVFVGSSVPYFPGSDVARTLYVLSASNPARQWQVHAGGQSYEYVASGAPTVTAGGGQSDIQIVTITGAPTGGTFTLTYSGQTTAAIARNATAAAVQTALRALTDIGATGVNVTGGPGPSIPWTVTFAGTLANIDVAQMTATSALTGGTAPAVAVQTLQSGIAPTPPDPTTSTTQPTLTWSYNDPDKDSQAGYQVYLFTQAFVTANPAVGTDPTVYEASAVYTATGTDPAARGVTVDVDLTNGAYRYYVRAQDSAGLWSAWSTRGWTQSVPLPATPTAMTATADSVNYRTNLSVAATAGAFVRFDKTDDGGLTWQPVRGAEAVTRTATTTAVDYDMPNAVARAFRAVAFSTAPRTASLPSATATATLTGPARYLLTSTANPTLGGVFIVQDPVGWTRTVRAGVFEGSGAEFATVVDDGVPKAPRRTLHLMTPDAATWAKLEALVLSRSTLVLRDPWGDVSYCRVAGGDWTRELSRMASSAGGAVVAHAHTTDLPLVQVAQPTPVA